MGSDWGSVLFENAPLQILDGDRGKNYPKKIEFKEIGFCLFLNTGNVSKDGFKFSSTDFISSERDNLLKKGKLQREDVILTTRGTVGNVAYFNSSIQYDHIRINSGMVILRTELDKLTPRFLYFFLRSKLFRVQVDALQSGSAQPQLPIRDIKKISIPLPSVKEQKAIAHILGSLDDKIELNRQMNQTLESMAQALFKSWFVDFDPVIDNALAAGNAIPDVFAKRAEARTPSPPAPLPEVEGSNNNPPLPSGEGLGVRELFPSEFEYTEEMGWIPKGWGVGTLASIGRVITGKTPPKKIENAYCEKGIPFITPTDVDDSLFVTETNRYLSEQGELAVIKSKICSGTICVTCIGSQMGKTIIAPSDSFTNQQINSIEVFSPVHRNYLFLNLRSLKEEIFLMGSSGSTMPIINKSTFEKIQILVSDEKLLISFDNIVSELMNSVLANQVENLTLTKLRDTLLPKLLSGELRIPEAEKLVSEVY